ncbi:MAG TPA: hypothetical protein ENN74_00315 [Firmicutes bacterium]|nr:hypothetical protein [Bacillota bacterium]
MADLSEQAEASLYATLDAILPGFSRLGVRHLLQEVPPTRPPDSSSSPIHRAYREESLHRASADQRLHKIAIRVECRLYWWNKVVFPERLPEAGFLKR